MKTYSNDKNSGWSLCRSNETWHFFYVRFRFKPQSNSLSKFPASLVAHQQLGEETRWIAGVTASKTPTEKLGKAP